MNYKDVLKEARGNLNKSCRVCPICNGVACAGRYLEWEEKEPETLLK